MIDQENAVDLANTHFDELVNGKFATAYLVIQTVRGILERFGVKLPDIHPTGFDEEIVLRVVGPDDQDQNLCLCIMIDQDERGHYDAYAQFVDEDDLDDIEDMDISTEPVTNAQLVSPYLRQARRSEDN